MAVDIFLEIKGIKGESRDKEHAGKIDVLAWSWGLSQSGSGHVGGGSGSGKANVQDMSVTKYVDKASPDIMGRCSTGKHYDEATLILRKAGDKPMTYMTIKMTQVLITSYSTGGSGGEDRLTENVSLNFSKVEVNYTEQKPDGGEGEKPKFTFDVAANAKA